MLFEFKEEKQFTVDYILIREKTTQKYFYIDNSDGRQVKEWHTIEEDYGPPKNFKTIKEAKNWIKKFQPRDMKSRTLELVTISIKKTRIKTNEISTPLEILEEFAPVELDEY